MLYCDMGHPLSKNNSHKSPINKKICEKQKTSYYEKWQFLLNIPVKRPINEIKINQNQILRLQYGHITKESMEIINEQYRNQDIDTIWLINFNDCSQVNRQENYIDIDQSIPIYRRSSFSETIFIENSDTIYKILSFSNNFQRAFYKSAYSISEFIDIIRNNGIEKHSQITCIQRGAGNGKTYEIAQLVKKSSKNILIYLTKTNTATFCILNEIKKQYKLDDTMILKLGRQYYVNFNDKKILIGTIDSFFYSICGIQMPEHIDFFMNLADHISQLQKIQFRYKQLNIDKDSIIIVDEVQDLPKAYAMALKNIQNKTNTELYMVGDLLQSLFYTENAMSCFKINNGQNVVRRFENVHLAPFINSVIDFNRYKSYKLMPISNILPQNRYDSGVVPHIYYYDYRKIDEASNIVKKVISIIDSEVSSNNYGPSDFMILAPTVKNNQLLQILEVKVEEYWRNRLMTPGHYAYLHYAQDNEPIDLTKSENATQILSIHASKGSGRNVVILLDMSEYNLKKFSQDSQSLIYESLLHVSLTRQKRHLYIGITDKNDDLGKRFRSAQENHLAIWENLDIDTNIKITKHIKIYKLQSYIQRLYVDGDVEAVSIIDNLIKNIKIKYNNESDTAHIDYNHHMIRHQSFIHKFKTQLNKTDISKSKQFYAQLQTVREADIQYVHSDQYIRQLIDKNNRDIGILMFEQGQHNRYGEMTREFLIKIQDKIKNRKWNGFCDVEALIYKVAEQQIKHKYYSEISILQLYRILQAYHHNFDQYINLQDMDDKKSYHNDCICKSMFMGSKINDTDKSNKNLVAFYGKLSQIPDRFSQYMALTDNKKYTYNFDHNIWCEQYGQFKINEIVSLVGLNSDLNETVNIRFVQNFSKLNFIQILIEQICSQYIIINSNSKFRNVALKNIIISLDIEPQEFQITNEDIQTLEPLIKRYLIDTYTKMNRQVSEYMIYRLHGTSNQQIIQEIKKQMEKWPSYMKTTITYKIKKICNGSIGIDRLIEILDEKLLESIEMII